MTINYDGHPGTGRCWYGLEVKDCNPNQVYIARCGNDSRQRFRFVSFANGEALIQIGNGSNNCLQRYRTAVYIRNCDENNALQRWYAPNGSFDGNRFEISQKDTSTQCVSTRITRRQVR